MIPGVILAAGESTRMGRPKACLPIGQSKETFLSRIVGTLVAADLEDLMVVVGAHAPAVEEIIVKANLPVRLVANRAYTEGQLSSLLAALRIIDRPGVTAMLVALVDVPLFSTETVRAVLGAYRRTGAPIVRPVREGRHGHPVVFDRVTFDELRHANPAEGARAVVHAHAHDAVDVPVDDEGAFTDVDTPEDYARIIDRLCSDA